MYLKRGEEGHNGTYTAHILHHMASQSRLFGEIAKITRKYRWGLLVALGLGDGLLVL